MQLVEFQGQVGTRDAFAIRARDLDSNFRKLKPQTNGQYGINETIDGWSLNIFPAYPEEAEETQAFFLSYIGGALEWSEGAAISPAATAGAHYITLATTGGSYTAGWSSPPDIAGTATTGGWRLVERCDGYQMYVWGTAWVNPS